MPELLVQMRGYIAICRRLQRYMEDEMLDPFGIIEAVSSNA